MTLEPARGTPALHAGSLGPCPGSAVEQTKVNVVPELVVVALGGNAIAERERVRAEQQVERVRQTADAIVEIVEEGYRVCLAHGNGPQVGSIVLQQHAADSGKTPAMPLDVCGAMSQGMIGYWLQQALQESLEVRGLGAPCATVISRTLVDPADPAFQHPTKPIGPFYGAEEAQALARESGHIFREDSGRGYRRVVPSPRPVEILELQAVRHLLNEGCLVIAAGGGGIPVLRHPDTRRCQGVEAVIDKDLAAATLADQLDADVLLILTSVPGAALHFGRRDQTYLGHVTIPELEGHVRDGEFAPGSMLPKVEACIGFVRGRRQRRAAIATIEDAVAALHGQTGTQVRP